MVSYVIMSYSWQTNTVRKGTIFYRFVAATVRMYYLKTVSFFINQSSTAAVVLLSFFPAQCIFSRRPFASGNLEVSFIFFNAETQFILHRFSSERAKFFGVTLIKLIGKIWR